jgi:hypothetical protein
MWQCEHLKVQGFFFHWSEHCDITVDAEFLCNTVAMPRSVMKETVAKYKTYTEHNV